MSAVEAGFEEFLRQALSIIDLLIFFICFPLFLSPGMDQLNRLFWLFRF